MNDEELDYRKRVLERLSLGNMFTRDELNYRLTEERLPINRIIVKEGTYTVKVVVDRPFVECKRAEQRLRWRLPVGIRFHIAPSYDVLPLT